MSSTDWLVRLACAVLVCAVQQVRAGAAEVCPARPGDPVQQIHLFDGPPADQAYLAPDDNAAAANRYTLSPIYARGGFVTVRCTHQGGSVVDITLPHPTSVCRFRRDAVGASHLRCR